MPRMRKLIRGYNQAELIAYALGKRLSLPVRLALARTKSPSRQATITEKALRMKNQKGSFGVVGDVSHKTIILVDDVTTTGATLLEARAVLLKHQAKSVHAFALAH